MLIIEIKGFAAHVRDMDRQKYCSELNRETFLHEIGYQVVSFAYDDVERHFEIDHKTAVQMLHRLVEKGWMAPSACGSGKRIVRYDLTQGVLNYFA